LDSGLFAIQTHSLNHGFFEFNKKKGAEASCRGGLRALLFLVRIRFVMYDFELAVSALSGKYADHR
jgi:hypothetical protein